MVRHELPLPRPGADPGPGVRAASGQVAAPPARGRPRSRRAPRRARTAVAAAAGQGTRRPADAAARARVGLRELLGVAGRGGRPRGPARRAVPGAGPQRGRAGRVPRRLRGPLPGAPVEVCLATYFGELDRPTLERVAGCPIAELHVDLVGGPAQLDGVLEALPEGARLSAGVIDARNVWSADLDLALDRLDRVVGAVGSERLTIAPSCSLLHVPYSLEREDGVDPGVRAWLAFGREKLDELALLGGRSTPPARSATSCSSTPARRWRRAGRRAGQRRTGAATGGRAQPRRPHPLASAGRALGAPARAAGAARPADHDDRVLPSDGRDPRRAPAATLRRARPGGLRRVPARPDRADRHRAGEPGPGRARARRARAQRHGRVLRRAAEGLRVLAHRLGAVVWEPLRQAPDPLRRRVAAGADDRALVAGGAAPHPVPSRGC